jgi:hypothetical protein
MELLTLLVILFTLPSSIFIMSAKINGGPSKYTFIFKLLIRLPNFIAIVLSIIFLLKYINII